MSALSLKAEPLGAWFAGQRNRVPYKEQMPDTGKKCNSGGDEQRQLEGCGGLDDVSGKHGSYRATDIPAEILYGTKRCGIILWRRDRSHRPRGGAAGVDHKQG